MSSGQTSPRPASQPLGPALATLPSSDPLTPAHAELPSFVPTSLLRVPPLSPPPVPSGPPLPRVLNTPAPPVVPLFPSASSCVPSLGLAAPPSPLSRLVPTPLSILLPSSLPPLLPFSLSPLLPSSLSPPLPTPRSILRHRPSVASPLALSRLSSAAALPRSWREEYARHMFRTPPSWCIVASMAASAAVLTVSGSASSTPSTRTRTLRAGIPSRGDTCSIRHGAVGLMRPQGDLSHDWTACAGQRQVLGHPRRERTCAWPRQARWRCH